MSEETNLNGLMGEGLNGTIQQGASSTARKYASDMIQNYWRPAMAAAAAIRRDMEAAEKAASGVYRMQGAGGGDGGRIKATFSADSSGSNYVLSQGTSMARWNGGGPVARRAMGGSSIMPYGNQDQGFSTPSGGGGGGNGGQTRNLMPSMPVMAAGAMAAVGGLAAFGKDTKYTAMMRDLVANQMASASGRPASSFYSNRTPSGVMGQYGSGLGSTSTLDFLQGQGAIMNMGFLPGTAQFAGIQKQTAQMAMATGLGFAGSTQVQMQLQSANVQNRGRAMLGLKTLNADGTPRNYNDVAKDIMSKLYTGSGPMTSTAVAKSLRPGGALDYALDQLGITGDAKTAIEGSMRAQAVGGTKQTVGAANASKLKSVEKTQALEGDTEGGAVAALTKLNDTASGIKSGLDKFLSFMGLGGAAGATSQVAHSVGNLAKNPFVDYLTYKGIKNLASKGASEAESLGSKAGGLIEGAAPELLGGAEAGLKIGAKRFMPIGVGGYQDMSKGTWIGLHGQGHLGMPGQGDSGTYYGPNDLDHKHGTTFSPSNPLTSAAFTGSDGAGAGGTGGLGTGPSGSSVVDIAKKYLGTPYKWGGNEPGGFDCSGFVKYVYGQLGISLPRTSSEQSRMGTSVASLAAAIPGDLLFWDRPGHVHHVAIYIGSGMMIAAPHTGTNVQVQRVYGRPFIRRVLGNTSTMSDKNSNVLTGTGSAGNTTVGGTIASLISSALSTSSTGVSGNDQTAAGAIAAGLSGGGAGGAGIHMSSGSTGMGSGSTSMSSPGPSLATGSSKSNEALARKMASAMGWGSGNEWAALDWLWNQESSFKTTAGSPAHAYGIPQSLPGSKMASAGADWLTNPATQIKWGLGYIEGRYKDPIGAVNHKHQTRGQYGNAEGWYAQGAFDVQQDQTARVHSGEMIIPADKAKSIRGALKKGGAGGGGNVINLTINVQQMTDSEMTRVIKFLKQHMEVDTLVQAMASS